MMTEAAKRQADAAPDAWLGAGLDSLTVMVVGDVMLDRFVQGVVRRVSPEAPVPVIAVEGETESPGGAGNVARNVAALGAKAALVGAIGDDAVGGRLSAMLDRMPGIESTLIVEPGRPTTLKTRYLARGEGGAWQQLLRADAETDAPLSAATNEALLRAVEAAAGASDSVVFSDYAKGVVGDSILPGLLERCAGARIVVDPKSADFARYRGAAILTPNAAELARAAGHPCEDDSSVEDAARKAISSGGFEALVVTRGARGLSVVTDGTALHLGAAERREIYDVTGAGDTATAILATALSAGASIEAAARSANAGGGMVVGKVGSAVVRGGELAAALHALEVRAAADKVATLEAALDHVARWRRRGETVGFTNGCFDLLHPGHVALLAQARGACDRLVVGLNSDGSARRLKGADRPVQPESARAAVLASLKDVDLVVAFDADTPIGLIEAVRPEVLVKGADYRLEEVVGADFVQAYGGRVLLADIAPGHSTTATIARLAG